MRKLWLLCALLALGGVLFAQEAEAPLPPAAAQEAADNGGFAVWQDMPWSLGASYEVGMNTRNASDNFASSFGISVDRYLFTPFAMLGILVNLHSDTAEVAATATEVLLNFRANAPIGDSVSIFVQWGFGYFLYREEAREKDTYTMNFLAGCRIYLMGGSLRGFYLEPYVRAGYPFLFGGGLALGHWFNF